LQQQPLQQQRTIKKQTQSAIFDFYDVHKQQCENHKNPQDMLIFIFFPALKIT
jgi:hypothetical protein